MNNQYKIIDLVFQGIPGVIGAFLIPVEGGWVLVESGPHSSWHNLISGLKTHDIKPEDIKGLLLTHIHLDHAGAAWALAKEGVPVYVHPAGRQHLIDPSRLMQSARRIYQDEMDRLWGNMEGIPDHMVFAVEDEAILTFGNTSIVAHHTPGHAIHHIAWQWGNTLFTGDVGGIRIKDDLILPPCPPPEFDLISWKKSISRMRKLPVERLVLTHFGTVTDCQAHWDMLLVVLKEWVQYFEALPTGIDTDNITRDFEEWVNRYYYHALSSVEKQQYQNANPLWMSVTGIRRYLEKQSKT